MDLKVRAVKSVSWFVATRFATQMLSWMVTIVMARLLTPGDYGVFAMALSVLTLLELFQELGLGTAIVQRQDLKPQQLTAVFWIVSTASVLLASLAWVGAGAAATFYSEPRLVGIIRLLSVAFVLNSLGIVPYNLLTRDIDFRSRSLAETAGVVTSAVVSVALAYLDYGVWALTYGYLVRAAVRNATMATFCGWIPGWRVSFHGMRRILSFGLGVAGSSIMTSLSPMLNSTVIGRLMSGESLGLYSMADALATGPHRIFVAILNQVSFPVFASLQTDTEELTRYFLKITKYTAMVSLPIQVGMTLLADDLVVAVLQEQWRPLTELFRLFCVGSVAFLLSLTAASLLLARGRAGALLKVTSLSTIGLAVALAAGASFGLVGLGVAWLVVFVPLRAYLLSLGLAELRLSVSRYIANVAPPLMATAVMGLTLLVVGRVAVAAVGDLVHLLFMAAVGGVVYLVSISLIDRSLGADVRSLVRDLRAPAST